MSDQILDLTFYYLENDSTDFPVNHTHNSKFGYEGGVGPLYDYTVNEILNAIGFHKPGVATSGARILNYLETKGNLTKSTLIFANSQFSQEIYNKTVYQHTLASGVNNYNIVELIDAGNGDTSKILETITAYAHNIYSKMSNYRPFSYKTDVQNNPNCILIPECKQNLLNDVNTFSSESAYFSNYMDYVFTCYREQLRGEQVIDVTHNDVKNDPLYINAKAGWLNLAYYYNSVKVENKKFKTVQEETVPLTYIKNSSVNVNLEKRFGAVKFMLKFPIAGGIGIRDNPGSPPKELIIRCTMYIVPTDYVNSLAERTEIFIYEDDDPFSWMGETSLPLSLSSGYDKVNAGEMSTKIMNETKRIWREGGYNQMFTYYLTKNLVKVTVFDKDPGTGTVVPKILQYNADGIKRERDELLKNAPNIEYTPIFARKEPVFVFSTKKNGKTDNELKTLIQQHISDYYFYYGSKYLHANESPATSTVIKNNVRTNRLPIVYPELFENGEIVVLPIFSNGYVPPSASSAESSNFIVFRNKSKYVDKSKQDVCKHNTRHKTFKSYLITSGLLSSESIANNPTLLDNVEIIHPSILDASPLSGGSPIYGIKHAYPLMFLNTRNNGLMLSDLLPHYIPLIGLTQDYQGNTDSERELIEFHRLMSYVLNALTLDDTKTFIENHNRDYDTAISTTPPGQIVNVNGIAQKLTYKGDTSAYVTGHPLTATMAESITFKFKNMHWVVYGPMGTIANE